MVGKDTYIPPSLLARLFLIGDHFKDSFTVVDMNVPGRFCRYVNSVFSTHTGYSRREVVGRNLNFLQGPDTTSQAVDFMKDCFSQEAACCQDIVNYKKNGEAFINRLVMLPLKHKEFYYLGFQNDVTDRYEVGNGELELAQIKAGEINHVMNNSLASVLLNLDVALSEHANVTDAMRAGSEMFERINSYCLGIDLGINKLDSFADYSPA